MRLPAADAGPSVLVRARRDRGTGARPLRRPRATPATNAFALAIPVRSVGHLSWGSFRTPSPTPGANPGAGTLPHSGADRGAGGVLVRGPTHDLLSDGVPTTGSLVSTMCSRRSSRRRRRA